LGTGGAARRPRRYLAARAPGSVGPTGLLTPGAVHGGVAPARRPRDARLRHAHTPAVVFVVWRTREGIGLGSDGGIGHIASGDDGLAAGKGPIVASRERDYQKFSNAFPFLHDSAQSKQAVYRQRSACRARRDRAVVAAEDDPRERGPA